KPAVGRAGSSDSGLRPRSAGATRKSAAARSLAGLGSVAIAAGATAALPPRSRPPGVALAGTATGTATRAPGPAEIGSVIVQVSGPAGSGPTQPAGRD